MRDLQSAALQQDAGSLSAGVGVPAGHWGTAAAAAAAAHAADDESVVAVAWPGHCTGWARLFAAVALVEFHTLVHLVAPVKAAGDQFHIQQPAGATVSVVAGNLKHHLVFAAAVMTTAS